MTETTKRCPDCRLELPSHAFRPNKTTKSGLHPYCRSCNSTRMKAYRDETPEQKATRKEEIRLRKLAEHEAVLARASEREAARQAEIARRQAEGKVCPRCGTHKSSSEFHKNRTSFDGLSANCKGCHRSICLGWAERNADTLRERARVRRRRPEACEAKNRRKREVNLLRGTSRTEHYGHFLQWQRHCADTFFALFDPHDAHVAAYTAEQKEVRKRSMQALKSDANAHVSAYRRRRRTGRELRTRRDIHANIYVAFKGWVRKRLKHAIPEGFTWATLFPYSPADVAQHLESKFLPGMGWHNRSDWHIDHIRPISSFGIDHWDSDAWKTCFALENLQPLWATDNIKKGARVS